MKIGVKDIKNPLEIIECQIAFHSRDWSTHKRDRLIYAIVFGWDDEVYRNEFGWDDNFIKEVKMLHEKWQALKQIGELEDETNKTVFVWSNKSQIQV